MTTKDVFEICSMICDKHINKNPDACFKYNDKQYLYTDFKAELDKLKEWLYPVNTHCVKLTVDCQHCIHYKSYQHIESGTSVRTMRCNLDNLPKQPNHYCGYGEESES